MLTSPEVNNTGEAEVALLAEWQRRLEESKTGRRTFKLFPNVVERLENGYLEPSRSLVHFITGKGLSSAFLRKQGFIDSSVCVFVDRRERQNIGWSSNSDRVPLPQAGDRRMLATAECTTEPVGNGMTDGGGYQGLKISGVNQLEWWKAIKR
uniref:Uncharacterized protein n=1 Tax=Timema cristinae TaxID=61476 RepID=A0A7R9CTZ9_TIMCR|nr:unnamed protein product [Timema cristinae]